jgi:hypothetical protein
MRNPLLVELYDALARCFLGYHILFLFVPTAPPTLCLRRDALFRRDILRAF